MFGPEVYSIDFFRTVDFKRKTCSSCNAPFWTSDWSREICGEAPCEPYTFIERPPAKSKYTIDQMRDSFLNFFNRLGHAVIDPYPVIPRWRRDLFLVSASIVDFQPYVTSGLAEPPANPLVISQPCIRLVDIDKVGLTFGRHMTIFEMGGAHAFNFPDRKVYWKDETVMYCHDFIRSLGVDEDLITYKESVWSGGGNAGPCFEVIVGGLEVATLVFMSYRTSDNDLIEVPVKTVDTGYGIERFTWLTQGTVSAFDAVYAGLIYDAERLIERPRIDQELLRRYARYSAWIKPDRAGSVGEARRVAGRLASIDVSEIERQLRGLEQFYAALDFSKALSFILAEGIVPSNIKVGYLARLLLRRTYRLLSNMRSQDRLLDLIELQLRWWGKKFPKLSEMRDEVMEIVDHEVKKFEATVEKGRQAVERELSLMKKRGAQVSEEFFVRMYDEKGITPDIVTEVASRLGMNLAPPENIYELVAMRHSTEREDQEEVDKRVLRFEPLTGGLPPTVKTYYQLPFLYRDNAKVLRVLDGAVILDRTVFYPEGGGQVADTGTIYHRNGRCRVTDVQLLNDLVVHFIDGEPPKEGEEVTCEVDAERRLSIVRHHTATHILIGACRRVLGRHAWQMGARKEPERGRLDVSHHKRLTIEDVRRIEELANSVIRQRVPVGISWMKRSDAESKFGFFIYQGGEVPLGTIRIVEVKGWDAEACGGLHCESSEDVGLIKIVHTERIQDGVERLIFTAGPAALPYVQSSFATVEYFAEALSSPVEMVKDRLDDVLGEVRELRKTIRRLAGSLATLKADNLIRSSTKIGHLNLVISREEIDEEDYLLSLAQAIVKRPEPTLAVLISGEDVPNVIVVCNEGANGMGVDAGKIVDRFSRSLGGRGGGKRDFGKGGGGSFNRLEPAIDDIRSFLGDLLSTT
ncbi:MAG: alanine--tRNA ligase [Aigarchaeota archaeon]|nr:alanine--tRNA ligase [Aigarchaeota archaeon]MDW8092683.1 alanine--tRNA ligase [Nitrososphaerota archaeon]